MVAPAGIAVMNGWRMETRTEMPQIPHAPGPRRNVNAPIRSVAGDVPTHTHAQRRLFQRSISSCQFSQAGMSRWYARRSGNSMTKWPDKALTASR
jgi:hypothetical protein